MKNFLNYIKPHFIFLIVAATPLVRSSHTQDPSLLIQFLFITSFLLLAFSYFTFFKTKLTIYNQSLKQFLVVCIFYLIISFLSVFNSPDVGNSLFIFSKQILFFIFFLAILLSNDLENKFVVFSRLITITSLILVLPAYYTFLELINLKKFEVPLSTYNLTSVFGHRNLFAQSILLCLPFVVNLLKIDRKYWRILGGIAYTLILFLIVILSNRTVWLAVVTIIFFIIGINLLKKKRKGFFHKFSLTFIVASALIVGLGYTVMEHYSEGSTFTAHATESFNINKGSGKDRMELWKRTLFLAKEKPFTGIGLGRWNVEMLKYGNTGLVSEDNNHIFYQRPHNDFLWIASEQGIFSSLLYIILFVCVLLALIRNYLNEEDNERSDQLKLIGAITIAFMVFSSLSFPRERIFHNVILMFSWGVFFKITNKETKNKKIVLYRSLIVIPILLVAAFYVGLIRCNSDKNTGKVIRLHKKSRTKACIQEVENAQSFFYSMDATSTPLYWYSGLAYYKLGKYEKAKVDFEKALVLNPYHSFLLNDYAGVLIQLGDLLKAESTYLKVIHLAPGFLEPKLNLCALYYKQKDVEKAFHILKSIDISETSERYIKTRQIFIKNIILRNYHETNNKIQTHRLLQRIRDNEFQLLFMKTAIDKKLDSKQIINEY